MHQLIVGILSGVLVGGLLGTVVGYWLARSLVIGAVWNLLLDARNDLKECAEKHNMLLEREAVLIENQAAVVADDRKNSSKRTMWDK